MNRTRLLFSRVLCATLAPAALAAVLIAPPAHAQLVRSAAGPNAADIQATVDLFRADLGTLNPNVAGSFGSGRREINWDGVPDNFSAPTNLPADFFNVNSPRGVVFSTPGSGFRVSADSSNPTSTPTDFGDIDPGYPQIFRAFSAERLFTPIGSNITDVNFFIPGSSTAALVRGFGVVFSDVDLANTTSIQYFDANNVSLGTFFAPATTGSETFSFLGVSYALTSVARVRITTGNQVLAAGNSANDLVVMDDFIYSEPITAAAATAPEPGSLALLLPVLGVVGMVARRRRK
jgi:hypothetical protein